MKTLVMTVARLLNLTRTNRNASAIVALAAVVFLFSAGAARSRATKADAPNTAGFSSNSQTTASAGQRAKEKIGSESIGITRQGFEPREISRTGGRFFLLVQNRSGVNPLVFRVTAQSGSVLKEFTLTRDQLDWADEINVPEGQYTVTEVNHGWTCHLTISNAP